jgi:hypothetical protein
VTDAMGNGVVAESFRQTMCPDSTIAAETFWTWS